MTRIYSMCKGIQYYILEKADIKIICSMNTVGLFIPSILM